MIPYKNNFSCILLKTFKISVKSDGQNDISSSGKHIMNMIDGFGVPRFPGGLGDVCALGYPGAAENPSNARDPGVRRAPEVLEDPGLLCLPYRHLSSREIMGIKKRVKH